MATKRKAVIQDTEILAIFIDSSTQSDQFVCDSESSDSEFVQTTLNTIKDIAGIKLNLLEKMNLILARKDDKLEVHCPIGYQLLSALNSTIPSETTAENDFESFCSGTDNLASVTNEETSIMLLETSLCGCSSSKIILPSKLNIKRSTAENSQSLRHFSRSMLFRLLKVISKNVNNEQAALNGTMIFDDDVDMIGPPNKDMAIIITKRFDVLGTRSTFNPLTCFTGPQEFYRDFIILAATTSTAFIQHLLDNMIDELLSLNRTVFTASDLEESGIRSPPLDILKCLESAITAKNLVLTLPWIVEFLSMMDEVSCQLPYNLSLFEKLFEIYYDWTYLARNSFEIHGFVYPQLSISLVTFLLGWLFDTLHTPVALYFSWRFGKPLPSTHQGMCGHLGSSIDILDIVDKKSLYFCCPFIREVQLLLGSHHSEISPILDSCIEKRVLPSSVDFIISEHFENSVIEKNKMLIVIKIEGLVPNFPRVE
ncbi:unnamed protein product, partial [Timema podura]|nr:unnamed protein product [Timema podura]